MTAPEGRTPAPQTPLDALVDALYEDGCLPPPRTDHTLHVIASLQRQGFAIEAAAGVRVAEPPATFEPTTGEPRDAQVCADCGTARFLHHDGGAAYGYICPGRAMPQPESGSAGTSGALRAALERMLAASDPRPDQTVVNWLIGPGNEFAEAREQARAALAAPAEPKP